MARSLRAEFIREAFPEPPETTSAVSLQWWLMAFLQNTEGYDSTRLEMHKRFAKTSGGSAAE